MSFDQVCIAHNVAPETVREFIANGGFVAAFAWRESTPASTPSPEWVRYAYDAHQRMMERWW